MRSKQTRYGTRCSWARAYVRGAQAARWAPTRLGVRWAGVGRAAVAGNGKGSTETLMAGGCQGARSQHSALCPATGSDLDSLSCTPSYPPGLGPSPSMPFHAVSIPAATSPSLAPVRHPLSINVPERSYSHTTSTDAYTPITPTNENGHIGITRRRHSISSPKSRAASLDYPPRPAKRNSNAWDWRMNGWTKNGEPSSYIEPDVAEEEATPVAHPIDLTPPHPPASSSLHPLPKDPNNILPLSVASSPFVSPSISRVPSPHPPPRVDSNAEQICTVSSAVHPVASSAPGSSSSPRTSVSTSSSRVWPTGRSASRSSAEDDDRGLYGSAAGPSYHFRSWFSRAAGSVSPKISAPIAPRIIRLSSGRLAGTRRWGWIFEWFGMQSGPYGPEVPKRGGLSRRSDRERERLMGQGVRRRGDKKVLGSKWLARITAFIPTEPWSIVSSSLFFLCLS